MLLLIIIIILIVNLLTTYSSKAICYDLFLNWQCHCVLYIIQRQLYKNICGIYIINLV